MSGKMPFTEWSEYVAPLRSQSIFWHNIWSDCGKPHTGVVGDIMRKARARHHTAIGQVRINQNDISNNRIATALATAITDISKLKSSGYVIISRLLVALLMVCASQLVLQICLQANIMIQDIRRDRGVLRGGWGLNPSLDKSKNVAQ